MNSESEPLINEQINVTKYPIRCITWCIIGAILSFVIIFSSLEIDKLITATNYTTNETTVINSIEVTYLLLAAPVIIYFVALFRRNRLYFFATSYKNYPMLLMMMICGFVDVSYYITKFISIFSFDVTVFRILINLSELLFCVVILPFVIICVCYNVRSGDLRMETQTLLTMIVTVAGCAIIFVKRVCVTIERERFKSNFMKENKTHFIYHTAKDASNVLELVDITYILIGLVFLIDPVLKVTRLGRSKEDNYESTPRNDASTPGNDANTPRNDANTPRNDASTPRNDANTPRNDASNSFLKNISLVEYRWPIIVLSIVIVSVHLIELYMTTKVMNSTSASKDINQIVFVCSNMVSYIIGILFGLIYYYTDISSWKVRSDIYIRNDKHFGIFTSFIQLLYAIAMIVLCMTSYESLKTELLFLEIFLFLLLAIQVSVQAMCINSSINRHIKKNPNDTWKSTVFPPVALAAINFAFMIITILNSQYDIFTAFVSGIDKIGFVIIKNIAVPITILNRLHGMAFFVYLSIKQW